MCQCESTHTSKPVKHQHNTENKAENPSIVQPNVLISTSQGSRVRSGWAVTSKMFSSFANSVQSDEEMANDTLFSNLKIDNETELMHFLLGGGKTSQGRKLWYGKRFNCLHICF